jgi:hypothetical protein
VVHLSLGRRVVRAAQWAQRRGGYENS